MVGLDLRDREKKFKDGRHVGLDFYDLLIVLLGHKNRHEIPGAVPGRILEE